MAYPIVTYCQSNGWVNYSGTYSGSTPYVLQDPTGEFVLIDPNITVNSVGNLIFDYIGTTPNYFEPKVMVNLNWTAPQQQDALTDFMTQCTQTTYVLNSNNQYNTSGPY
ncbi:MAG: hypothetical protein E6R13_03865 [Spirochaetes bacterium]|nr:MAG: hypothetical protein E6R13_03865 [Spirochaetota bacterium]